MGTGPCTIKFHAEVQQPVLYGDIQLSYMHFNAYKTISSSQQWKRGQPLARTPGHNTQKLGPPVNRYWAEAASLFNSVMECKDSAEGNDLSHPLGVFTYINEVLQVFSTICAHTN